MATSGSASVKVTNYDTLKFEWSVKSQSIENNSSVVDWKMLLVAGASGAINSSVAKPWKVVVNGTTYTGSATHGISNNTTKTLASGSTTIKHNNDGSKSFSYSFFMTFEGLVFSGVSISNKSGSGTGTLNTIPRAATITAAPNFDDEDNPTITYSNPAGTAVNTLQACISLDGSKDDIVYRDISKTGKSYTFNLTDAERNVLRNATTGSNSRTVRFYVQTIISGTTYRNNLSKTFTVINAAPTLSPTVIDSNAQTVALTGDNSKFIRYYSNAAFTIGAAAKKGATIKSRKVECGSKSSTAASGTINAVESAKFVFSATDTRGNSVSKTLDKTLINYVKPTCVLSYPVITTDGTTTLNIRGKCFKGSFGKVSNTIDVQYRYKESGGNWSIWYNNTTITQNGNDYTATVDISGLDYTKQYTFLAWIGDAFYTSGINGGVYSAEISARATPVFDWGADDFQFNVPVGLNYNGYSYDLLGLFRAMTTTYTPECSVSTGDNYSSATITAHLTGCNLRIGLSATRKEAIAAGNFTNETVCVVDVNHGGKLANLYRVSFNTSTSGGVATLDCQASKIDNDTVRLTINLCAAAQSLTEFNAYFAMPCTIITKAYV